MWVRREVRKSSTSENEVKKGTYLYILKYSPLWTLSIDISYQTDYRNLLCLSFKNKPENGRNIVTEGRKETKNGG